MMISQKEWRERCEEVWQRASEITEEQKKDWLAKQAPLVMYFTWNPLRAPLPFEKSKREPPIGISFLREGNLRENIYQFVKNDAVTNQLRPKPKKKPWSRIRNFFQKLSQCWFPKLDEQKIASLRSWGKDEMSGMEILHVRVEVIPVKIDFYNRTDEKSLYH